MKLLRARVKRWLRLQAVCIYESALNTVVGWSRWPFVMPCKRQALRFAGATIGKNVTIYPGVWVMTGRDLVVGDDVDLAKDVVITTGGGVAIGSRTLVGYRAQIISMNHRRDEEGKIVGAGHVIAGVTIGDDVWIGANAIVLPGAAIPTGCTIAAGAVVTGRLAKRGLYAGVPARCVRAFDTEGGDAPSS